MKASHSPSICDYAGTDYAAAFWNGNENRDYEDQLERALVRELLPAQGASVIDIGAGFGRLATEYKDRFKKVVLLDYAQHLLEQARARYHEDPHVEYIQSSCYTTPFLDNTFECAMSFRLMHHIEDAQTFFLETYRILKPDGIFIVEFANKKNFLEIVRFFLGRSDKRPFSKAPYQYGEKVYFNFHPQYIKTAAQQAGFQLRKKISQSNFRLGWLKKKLGVPRLIRLEKICRPLFSFFDFGPSIVLVLKKTA